MVNAGTGNIVKLFLLPMRIFLISKYVGEFRNRQCLFHSWTVICNFHDIFSLLCGLKANLSLIEHGLWIPIIIFAGMAWKAKTKGNPGREIEIPSLEGR
jgi:hypothetical protein